MVAIDFKNGLGRDPAAADAAKKRLQARIQRVQTRLRIQGWQPRRRKEHTAYESAKAREAAKAKKYAAKAACAMVGERHVMVYHIFTHFQRKLPKMPIPQ